MVNTPFCFAVILVPDVELISLCLLLNQRKWLVSFSKEHEIISRLPTSKNSRYASKIVLSSERKNVCSPHCGMHEILNPRMLLNIVIDIGQSLLLKATCYKDSVNSISALLNKLTWGDLLSVM